MKKLIYIPIIHNQADLGSVSTQLSLEGEKKYGIGSWKNHLEMVDKSWENTESEISELILNVPYNEIRIYQDGLPVTGEIGLKIVKETAANGSKNYAIIDNLVNKGAILETAENKELLLKEYSLLSNISKAESPESILKAYLIYEEMANELLQDRDKHIAYQINTTLNSGETGIAFFGAAHSIIDKLQKEIEVVVLQMFKDPISLNLMKG